MPELFSTNSRKRKSHQKYTAFYLQTMQEFLQFKFYMRPKVATATYWERADQGAIYLERDYDCVHLLKRINTNSQPRGMILDGVYNYVDTYIFPEGFDPVFGQLSGFWGTFIYYAFQAILNCMSI